MQGLLLLSEQGHDYADSARATRDELGEVPTNGATDGDPISLKVGHLDAHDLLAPGSLLRGSLKRHIVDDGNQ